MYRVNFGNGQVSHRMRTRREALAYIAQCAAHGVDFHTSFFVEKLDAHFDGTSEWFRAR